MDFKKLFAIYDLAKPPEWEEDNDNSTTSDSSLLDLVNTNFMQYPMVTTIDHPAMFTDFEEFPGVVSPFDITANIPFLRTEIPEHNNKANDVVNIARLFVGDPYVWGSTDPDKGFDCSGLILYAYKLVGIDIPRTSHKIGKFGTEVLLSNILPGDIIYTSSSGPSGGHVKMVSNVSNGQIYVIEAKNKKSGIVESLLTDTSNIKSIRRIINNENMSYNLSLSFTSQSDFVNTLDNAYRQALQNKGLDPNFSTMLVALDAIETEYGKKVKGNFNYGNITAGKNEPWHNQTGKRKWRDFRSIEDYINEKIEFLSRKRYRFFETFTPSSNVTIAMLTLANRGYDPGNPEYGKRVNRVYNDVKKYLL